MDELPIGPFNPARHLHDLVGEFLEVGNPGKTPTAHRWCDVLGIARDDLSGLLVAYGHIIQLPAQVRDAIARLDLIDTHRERALAGLPAFEQVFRSVNLSSQCNAYMQHIKAEHMAQLDTAAMFIEQAIGLEPGMEEADREAAKKVRDKLEKIRTDVAIDPDLTPEVRAYLLRHLGRLSEALSLYAIDGIAPIIDAFDMQQGNDVRDEKTAKEAKRTTHWQKAKDALLIFETILRITAALGISLTPELEAPTPPAIEAGELPTGVADEDDPNDEEREP